MNKKVEGIFLTEFNFLKFIFLIFFLKKKYCVLDTYSYIFNHGSYLEKFVKWLSDKKYIETIKDRSNEIPYVDTGDCKRLTDIFSVSEEWMNKRFHMNKRGYYGNSFRHIVSSRTYALYEKNINLFYLSKSIDFPKLDYHSQSFYFFRYGINNRKNYYEFLAKYLFNFFLFVSSLVHCFYWILTHTKVFYKTEKYRFATDYNGGPRDMIFWDFINPKQEETLVVVRDEYTKETFKNLLNNYTVVYDDEGILSIYLALKNWIISIRDSIILFVDNINLPTDYYRQICFLPYKKVKYNAFFNKYNCKFFWGRDDYNYQHIIRSQELRKKGGYSLGCNHGVESINSLAFQLRQIDFDYYYMHGLYQYNNTYKKYWPINLVAKGIGSFFSNPTQHEKIKNTNGKNVAIIIAPSFHENQIFESIYTLANAFPELIFRISTKAKHRSGSDFGIKYQSLINSKNQNIKENKDDVYNMISDCKYIFSESSTLLAEAVYFNKVALCFDPDPKTFKYLYYRNFPELVFNDVDSLIIRINTTKNKTENYYSDPNLNQMIFKTKNHPWNIIKDDMILLEKK